MRALVAALVLVLWAGATAPCAAAAPTTWTETPVASYAHPDGYLSSITCPADDLCLAIRLSSAGPAVLRWDGTSWSTSHVLGTRPDFESAVACSGPSFCLATATSAHTAVTATFNGRRWVTTTPAPSYILAPTCPSAGRCVALSGESSVVRYDHGTWTALPALPAQPHGGYYALKDVSCAAMSDCFAVGSSYGPGGQNQSRAALHWDGSSWTRTVVPAPADAVGHYGSLVSVSCPEPGFCVSAGFYEVAGSHGYDPVVEQWDGVRWTPAAIPHLSTTFNFPIAVDCASGTSCLAIGSGTAATPTSVRRDYALRWDGAQWTQAPNPITPPDTSSHQLQDVACSPDGACTVVGSVVATGTEPPRTPLAERLAAGTWSLQAVPSVRSPYDGSLTDVSCVTTTWCMAVGGMQRVGSAVDQPYTQRWEATRWRLVDSPFLGDGTGFDSTLAAVSCPSRSFCLAVGRQTSTASGTNRLADLVERWDGSTWSVVAAPRPASSQYRQLVSVSCATATFCVAIATEGISGVPTLFTWRSGTWGDPVAFGQSDLLNDVACTSRTDCTAVGVRFGSTDGRPLIQHWDGSSWTEKLLTAPADSAITVLTSVSCPAAGTCVAVGDRDRGGNFPKPIAWTRDGSRWARSDPALPAGSVAAYTTAVDCTAADSCVLGGIRYGAQDFAMLVEAMTGRPDAGDRPVPRRCR